MPRFQGEPTAFTLPVLRLGHPTTPVGQSRTGTCAPGPTAQGLSAPGTDPMPLVEHRFEAMGSQCHVALIGADRNLLAAAEAEVRRLQAIWTRFESDSELSRLNARSGHVVAVSPELALLVQRSYFGYRLGAGYFDPFLGSEVVSAGYDRDFGLLDTVAQTERHTDVRAEQSSSVEPSRSLDSSRAEQPSSVEPSRTVARKRRADGPVNLDLRRRLVRLSRGAVIDSGGIGKGLGADLVSRFLIDLGASGAMVNLGGDLRVRGVTPAGGWRIALDDPFDADGSPHSTVMLRAGGLCTSTPLRRRWRASAGLASGETVAHHIIDPRTGQPLRTGIAAVTAIASSGWLAEVWAKAVLVAGPRMGRRLLRRSPTSTCVVVDGDGLLSQVSGAGWSQLPR